MKIAFGQTFEKNFDLLADHRSKCIETGKIFAVGIHVKPLVNASAQVVAGEGNVELARHFPPSTG